MLGDQNCQLFYRLGVFAFHTPDTFVQQSVAKQYWIFVLRVILRRTFLIVLQPIDDIDFGTTLVKLLEPCLGHCKPVAYFAHLLLSGPVSLAHVNQFLRVRIKFLAQVVGLGLGLLQLLLQLVHTTTQLANFAVLCRDDLRLFLGGAILQLDQLTLHGKRLANQRFGASLLLDQEFILGQQLIDSFAQLGRQLIAALQILILLNELAALEIRMFDTILQLLDQLLAMRQLVVVGCQ